MSFSPSMVCTRKTYMLSKRLRTANVLIVVCTLLFAALAGVTGLQPVQAQGSKANFEKTACKFDMPQGMTEGKDVQCGFMVVPEDHAKPDGATIKLAVAIVKSTADKPAD